MYRFTKILLALALVGLSFVLGCGAESAVSDNVSESGEFAETSDGYTVSEDIGNEDVYGYWVEMMDPFIIENNDWTYTFYEVEFMNAIDDEYPEIIEYFESEGDFTENALVIENLINGIEIVNTFAFDQYQQFQSMPEGSMASTWRTWHWWGYSKCYTGSDADTAEYLMSLGMLSFSLPGIGWISGSICGAYTATAVYLNNGCGGFCLNVPWVVPYIWLSCP